jgi:uncharacterized membrane protein
LVAFIDIPPANEVKVDIGIMIGLDELGAGIVTLGCFSGVVVVIAGVVVVINGQFFECHSALSFFPETNSPYFSRSP